MVFLIFCVSTTLFTLTFSLENVAVVEHSPKTHDDPRSTIKENINEYRKYLEDIKDLNVDVIVFPEYGLTGYVEDVENWAIDINKNEIIGDLSAMAIEYSINMIVNLLEKDDLDNYYNTNLVINKTGIIIAKYHKININPVTDSKLRGGNEVVEFMLEGKHFATITNDDILFDYPTNKFSAGVSYVAIPMNWKNIPPFNVGNNKYASSLRHKNNKVVLASNLNDVNQDKTGSGIYSQDGSESFITGEKTSKVITSCNSRKLRENIGTELGKLPWDLMKFISETTYSECSNLTWDGEFNHDNQRCLIHVPLIDNGLDPLIPWGVLSGNKEVKLNERTFNVSLCAYIACDTQHDANFELKNCRKRYNSDVRFEKVAIRSNLNFNKALPITLDYNLKPLDGVTFREVNGNIVMDVKNINQMLNMVAVIEYTPIIKVDNLNKITSGVSNFQLAYFYLVCSNIAILLHYVL